MTAHTLLMPFDPPIRIFQPGDDLVALTDLLHAAYRPLAEMGLHFTATDQTPEITARRIARAMCLVAELDGRFIGTITFSESRPDEFLELYREPGLFHFRQFGVHPDFKRRGLGRRLHDAALAHVRARGGKIMALDTAVPATHLIEMYLRWGYRIVGRAQWPDVNYESVLMTREIVGS
jgi:GNAT superfamily N-acetyltransferase